MATFLELAPAIRAGVTYPGGAFKSERHFLDFLIDGNSLWKQLKKPDMVSILCSEYAAKSLDESVKAVNRLLLLEEADHPNDRRTLFICSECGDLGCGAITSLILREGGAIIWKDFGVQNNYDDNIALTAYQGVGPFIFDAAAYERVITQARAMLPAL
jgi:hypothetical protein